MLTINSQKRTTENNYIDYVNINMNSYINNKTTETFFFIAYMCLNIPITHSSIDIVLWAIEQEFKHYPKIVLKNLLAAYINKKSINKKMQCPLEKFLETIPYVETKEGEA